MKKSALGLAAIGALIAAPAMIVAPAMIAAPAMAADMRMPVKAPPAAPVAAYNWSGFYLGGDLGWQGSKIGLSSPTGPLTYSATHSSFAGGGFIGAQQQFNQIVLGVEGGYLAATGNASLGSTSDISIFGPGGTGTGQVKLRDIWTIGARAGLAMGRWMPYVTGGYANGAFGFDAQNVPPAIVPETETAKSSGGGGYFGAGIDWAVTDNWIVGAEYRHYGFSTQTTTGVQSGAAFNTTEQVNIAPHTDTVMARASYKLDWGMH